MADGSETVIVIHPKEQFTSGLLMLSYSCELMDEQSADQNVACKRKEKSYCICNKIENLCITVIDMQLLK